MAVRFTGNFATDGVWDRARRQLRAVDRAANESDARWHLWQQPDWARLEPLPQDELISPLLEKLAAVPRTDVVVTGTHTGPAGGATALLGTAEPGAGPEDMTQWPADDVRAWSARHPARRFTLAVTVSLGKDLSRPGRIVEILVHELAAHAEPLADFLRVEDEVPGLGVLTTEAERHRRLHTGTPRYQLLGACYLEQFPQEGNGPEFSDRAVTGTADVTDTAADAGPPSNVVRLTPERHRRYGES
ncbi:hypothetical protein ACWENO_32860 [Streptomyces sp. NPDC004436]